MYLDEDLYWRQRAKFQLDKEGDANTKFFHAKATARKQKNEILGLLNDAGAWHEDSEGMASIIQSYFGQLFQSSNPNMERIDEIIEILSPRVTEEMQLQLAQPYSGRGIFCFISNVPH